MRKILNHVPMFLTPDLLEEGSLVGLLEELGYFNEEDKKTLEEMGENPKKRSQFVSSVVLSNGESPFRLLVKALKEGHAHNPTYEKLLKTIYSYLDRGGCVAVGHLMWDRAERHLCSSHLTFTSLLLSTPPIPSPPLPSCLQ